MRSDPITYWPVLGGLTAMPEIAIRRRTFQIEYLQYNSLAFESGYLSEDGLRREVLMVSIQGWV